MAASTSARFVAQKCIFSFVFQRSEARHHRRAVVTDLPIAVRLLIEDREVERVAERLKSKWQFDDRLEVQILRTLISLRSENADRLSRNRRVGNWVKVDCNECAIFRSSVDTSW